MKKVLIIGSCGMLGQELVKIYKKDKKYKTYAWDKDEIDIGNQKKVNEKISKLKPHIIINSAAYNAVDKAEEKKEFIIAKKINGLAPGYLAKAAKKVGAIFVHYSTDYVFDGDLEKMLEPLGCTHSCASCNLHRNFITRFGYDENARPNPISKYGQSKFLGEKEVQKVKGKNYIIRLSKLFGRLGTGKGAKRNFFDLMLELGRKNKEVKAVNEEVSCFTYAPDLAKETKKIIETKKAFGIYHIVNTDPCTWYEAVLELYKQANLKTKVIPVSASEFPRPAKRPLFSVLINTKLKPLRSYKKALREYLLNL